MTKLKTSERIEMKGKKEKGLNDWINNKSKLKGLICNLAKDEEKKKCKISRETVHSGFRIRHTIIPSYNNINFKLTLKTKTKSKFICM